MFSYTFASYQTMKKYFLFWVGGLSLLLGHAARSQAPATDSSQLAVAAAGLAQHYAAGRGNESRLYNGVEYLHYAKRYLQGHPFFDSAEAQPATVHYDGATYRDVLLRYDLVRDQLVIKAPLGALLLRLVNEKVTYFTLAGHSFVHLRVDSAGRADDLPVRTGFYDLLVDGRTQLLASRRKEIQERSTLDGMEGEINEKNDYFLAQGGRYYQVGNVNSVLALFPERKAALRKYSRAQKLRFRGKRREASLIALVRFAAAAPAAP